MSSKSVVIIEVLRRESENKWVVHGVAELTDGEDQEVNIAINSDDFVKLYLQDNPTLAKGTSCGSVIMPYAEVVSSGKKEVLSMTTPVHLVHEFYAKVARIKHPPLPVAKATGKYCGDCLLFSRDKGIELLYEDTHTFVENEKGQARTAIVDAVATTHKLPTLDKDNVGYCPALEGLCADTSPACEDDYKPIPKTEGKEE
jgi:hypothetical protein